MRFWAELEERSPYEGSRDDRALQGLAERSSDAELRTLLDLIEDDED